jgi:hypothetical protein
MSGGFRRSSAFGIVGVIVGGAYPEFTVKSNRDRLRAGGGAPP